jgi:hypothetical protein
MMTNNNTNNNNISAGTFKIDKLKNKKIEIRKGYHSNVETYELEEVEEYKHD